MRDVKLFVIALCVLLASVIVFLKNSTFYFAKPIHVFYEVLATTPAFLGMIEMVQLPDDEPKIFLWHRFPNRKDLIDLAKINAFEVESRNAEGDIYYAKGNFRRVLRDILVKYPKSPLIIHTNTNNYEYLFDGFLRDFPKERVKHVHLYEDGLAGLYIYNKFFNNIRNTKQDIQDLENYYYGDVKTRKLPKYAKYMLHTLFPTTYYFYGYENAAKGILEEQFFQQMKGASFKDINFRKIAKKLTRTQKEKLLQLLGFDFKKYKKIFEKNKVFIYFGGYYLEGSFTSYLAELNHISHLMKKYPDYYFLLKPHPSWSSFDRKNIFNKVFTERIELLDPRLPYETFIIFDLIPSKVSGRSSSLFFTLSNDMIDSYISHPSYENALNKLGIISKDKKIDLLSFITPSPLFYDEKIIKNGQEDFLINISESSFFLYNEKRTYQKKESKTMKLACSNNKCFKYEYIDDVLHFNEIEVFTLKHPFWQDVIIKMEEGKFCRLRNDDCGILKTQEKDIQICWEKWGCEFFNKSSSGLYVFDEIKK